MKKKWVYVFVFIILIAGIILVSSVNLDLNHDGVINITDLQILAAHFEGKATYNSSFDFNNDGKIDLFDVVSVARGINISIGNNFNEPSGMITFLDDNGSVLIPNGMTAYGSWTQGIGWSTEKVKIINDSTNPTGSGKSIENLYYGPENTTINFGANTTFIPVTLAHPDSYNIYKSQAILINGKGISLPGTVSGTIYGTVLTGKNTHFTTNLSVGSRIILNGNPNIVYMVMSVTNDTSLSITPNTFPETFTNYTLEVLPTVQSATNNSITVSPSLPLAPNSGNSLEFLGEFGDADAHSGIISNDHWSQLTPKGFAAKSLYVRLRVWLSPNWPYTDGDRGGMKFFYTKSSKSTNNNAWTSTGWQSGSLRGYMGNLLGSNPFYLWGSKPNALSVGSWHTIEFLFVMNKNSSVSDGRAVMWIDNNLVTNRSDVMYYDGSDTTNFNPDFDGLEVYPIRASIAASPFQADDYFKFGEIYVSGSTNYVEVS